MKIKEAIIAQIAQGDVQLLWEHFNLLEEDDYDDFDHDYDVIRYGKDVRFSIEDVWENRVFKHCNKVHVYDPETGIKRVYPLEMYRTEMLMRKSLMRKRLYENIAIEGNLVGRE